MNARDTHMDLPKSHLVLPNFTWPDLPAERLSSVLRDIWESYGIVFSLQVRTGSDLPIKKTQGKKRRHSCTLRKLGSLPSRMTVVTANPKRHTERVLNPTYSLHKQKLVTKE